MRTALFLRRMQLPGGELTKPGLCHIHRLSGKQTRQSGRRWNPFGQSGWTTRSKNGGGIGGRPGSAHGLPDGRFHARHANGSGPSGLPPRSRKYADADAGCLSAAPRAVRASAGCPPGLLPRAGILRLGGLRAGSLAACEPVPDQIVQEADRLVSQAASPPSWQDGGDGESGAV
jgi:hypothetical protein